MKPKKDQPDDSQVKTDEGKNPEVKPDESENPDTVRMIAIQPILHDGDRIEPGQTFSVTPKQAAALLKNKSARES